MLEELDSITIEELKSYLYSLEEEKTKEEEKQINIYKDECAEKQKEPKTKDIEWIQKVIEEEYQGRNETKDKILSLLKECEGIPNQIEQLEVSRYMLYRVDIIRAENVLAKAIKRLGKRQKKILEEILELIEAYPKLNYVKEINCSEYKMTNDILEQTKEKFIEEYSNEQKMELIQKELDIVAKAKVLNAIPIPHEVLKASDRDIQMKLQKFNSARQKRIIMLSSMESDYLKLREPREINCMIDDAVASIESISSILTEKEYKSIKNKLIRRRKKIYRNTNEIRSIIKYKEKKTGIANFNLQEARYERMENLRSIISEASKIIELNNISKAEEEYKRLKVSYDREKQYAYIIEKIEEEKKEKASQNPAMKALETRLNGLKDRIDKSKNTIEKQAKIIEENKKELITLWKIEIDNTISNKKEEVLELAETNEENKETKENRILKLLNKIKNAKVVYYKE